MATGGGREVFEFSTDDGLVVKIREVRLDDAPSLHRNCLSANTLEQVKSYLERDIREMEKGYKVRLVAVVGEEVVGNLEVDFSRHPLTPHIAEIHTVVVNPNFRRKGIAMRMIECALKAAEERDIEIVKTEAEAKNAPALKLYIKAGFEEYGRLERGLIRNGEFDDVILLKREIAPRKWRS